MIDKYVSCPDKPCDYWYPLDTEVFSANLYLCDLFNQLISEKLTTIKKNNRSRIYEGTIILFESGWYPTETWVDHRFNWTDGAGIIKITTNVSGITLQYRCIYRFNDMNLRILVNDILVSSENMVVNDFWKDYSIELKGHEAPFMIKIYSDYFIPQLCDISDDSRKLGIAVSEIKVW